MNNAKRIWSTAISAFAMTLVAGCAVSAADPIDLPMESANLPSCANAEVQQIIRGEYLVRWPGDPMPIAARELGLSDFTVTSALPAEMASGALIDSQQLTTVWESINEWGADTDVELVFSPSSEHAFVLKSKVPMIMDDPDPGYLDVYADEGRGVHSHIQMSKIVAVYVSTMPTESPDHFTRAIEFYDDSGVSIIGVYASIKTNDYDPKAVSGFEKTRNLIESWPSICTQ